MSIRALIVAAALAATPLTAAAVDCNADYDIEGDVDLDIRSTDGDIVFKRDGTEIVRITTAPELVVNDRTIALDAAGQADLVAYRDAYLELIDEAKAIGVAGAKLGGKAAYAVVVGLLTGTADEVEAKIEAEAKKLEEQAENLCVVVERMHTHHRSLAARVPEFAEALPVR